MAKTAFVGTRIDPDLKRDVERICDDLGLSLSQAITLFLKQLQLQEGLPFEVRLPSKATRDAIASAAERRDLKSYDDPDALYDDLDL